MQPRTMCLLVPVLAVTALAPMAEAACTDAAGPGVEWRRCFLDGSDLSAADLNGADLRDSSFKRSDFDGATLAHMQGRRAKFVSSSLQRVDFTGADLVQADFTSADLTGAVLVGATLRGARLYDANLTGADLTDAVLEGADLLRANFSGARWTDGKTICGEGSVGRCHPGGTGAKVQG
jgi:uncharacterized protein YjbI with pentapeptide repeats